MPHGRRFLVAHGTPGESILITTEVRKIPTLAVRYDDNCWSTKVS
jgi:hypothetical protein